MSIRCLLSYLLLLPLMLPAQDQKTAALTSPNKNLRFEIKSVESQLSYSLGFQNRPILLPSRLSMVFTNRALSENLTIAKVIYSKGRDRYSLPVGKVREVDEVYREALIELRHPSLGPDKMYLRVRLYNDGLAFRYEYPEQNDWKNYELLEENTTFNIAGNPVVFHLPLPSYTTSHEGLYVRSAYADLAQGQLLDVPLLFEFSETCYVAITEANLRDYAGMYLAKSASGSLISLLSPLPGQSRGKVKATLPHQSPWRVVMVSEKVGGLIESNLLSNLCDPPAFQDLSWLRPGKATWTWWNGDIYKNVDFEVGQNFETHKFHIDFCAENGIEYHSIIEHGNIAWYHGEGEGFDPPPPHADVTKPVASLDMERLAAYSKEKGVGLRFWVHWKPLSEKLEEAFALYEKWNVKGLMVDFMDRDDQEMVNWVEKVLQTAAKYHLHVQFHGAYKPTGLHRTFPNEFTKEGVLNLENLKWSKECDPEHNLMVPFTRMIAGPMDYHSGGFRAIAREKYEPKFQEPNVLGTRCHHMAMFVVYESYLQLVSDYPEAYKGQLGFDFVSKVPTVWDETRVISGRVGDYLAIARRKGETWYLGVMNDWTPRTLEISLDFLPKGTFSAEIYKDAPDSALDPNLLQKETKTFTRKDVLRVELASGGGFVMRMEK